MSEAAAAMLEVRQDFRQPIANPSLIQTLSKERETRLFKMSQNFLCALSLFCKKCTLYIITKLTRNAVCNLHIQFSLH